MHHWVGIWKRKGANGCLVITDKHYTWPLIFKEDIYEFDRATLRIMDQSANLYESNPLVYPQLIEWDHESTSNGESS